jgi:tetratricopeptide (TPR) repeat protein
MIFSKLHIKLNQSLGCIVFLFLIVLVIYGQTVNYDFVNYDDNFYITENPFIRDGLTLKGIEWAFSFDIINSQWVPANWIPLTHLSHLISVEIFGLSSGIHHVINIVFHFFNVVLLFSFFSKATGNLKASLMVASLFAIHPLHVESVAWIAERKDVLSLFFGLLAMHYYLKYVKKNSIRNWFGVCVLFFLALTAKPMLVSFPFVLLLLDYWPLKRINFFSHKSFGSFLIKNRNIILEKVPFFLITIISCFISLSFQANANALSSFQALSLLSRIENAIISYWIYLQKLLLPVGLTVFYPFPQKAYGILEVFFWFSIIIVISVFVIIWNKEKPYLLVGWFWFLGTLVPVIGLIQVGTQAFADRYMYLPSIGVYIVLCWELSNYQIIHKWSKVYISRIIFTITFFLMLTSFFQVKHWKNSVSLFSHTLQHTLNNETAHLNLGTAYSDREDVTKKLEHYLTAARINPNNHRTYYNIGDIFLKRGKTDKAIYNYKKALGIKPNFAKAHNNLGIALSMKGNSQQAVKHFQLALALDSQMVNARLNLETILRK